MLYRDYIFKSNRYGVDFGTSIDEQTYEYLCMEATTFNGVPWINNHTQPKTFKLTWKQRLFGTFTLPNDKVRTNCVFEFGSAETRDKFIETVLENWKSV